LYELITHLLHDLKGEGRFLHSNHRLCNVGLISHSETFYSFVGFLLEVINLLKGFGKDLTKGRGAFLLGWMSF